MEKKNTFEVNQNANLADIGTIINEAIIAIHEDYGDGIVLDHLSDIHEMIYPNASRLATPEENAAIAAGQSEKVDAFTHFYNISIELENAIDIIEHIIYEIGEEEMATSLQQSILAGSVALVRDTILKIGEIKKFIPGT